MPKLPSITAKRFIRIISKIEFTLLRVKGSHHIYQHADGRVVIVPMHHKDIPKGTLHGMITDINLSTDQFIKLLKT